MTFDLQTWSFMEVSQSHQCLEHLWKPLKLSGNIPEELSISVSSHTARDWIGCVHAL